MRSFSNIYGISLHSRSGLMVSALDSGASGPGSRPGRGQCLCSWARHITLTVPLSTQMYKWVPAICWGNLTKLLGSDLRLTPVQGN